MAWQKTWNSVVRVNVEPQKVQKPCEQPWGKILTNPYGRERILSAPWRGRSAVHHTYVRYVRAYVRT